ncbi:Uncharacterized protein BM_BM8074 [Brugia malayi]|nr:Uncharacterized protein BM_BM8074 [Brugia malayi]VIO94926.1 Uncharacterized protein BM_BM8074 [Brugia malayi]
MEISAERNPRATLNESCLPSQEFMQTVLSHHTGCSPTSLESLKELG